MEDTEDTTTAMAQAMGFSSFGTQDNPNKRRRFNPRADAVVASTSTPTGPPHHNSVSRRVESGSNATPLGVRTRNEDEIDLEGIEDEANPSTGGGHNTLNNDDDNNRESRYLDTSHPPAAIAVDLNDDDKRLWNSGTIGVSFHDFIGGPSSFGGPMAPRRGGGYRPIGGRAHESEKEWWEDYYDPSSNVNPWEQLEQTKGLGPRGRWMSWEEAKG
ncbi:hypothetical protein M434DRAFT_396368 [Hypoxylon sp. CO27-5]|nr:hypothetical protein M434DRAFT_396368 [Hypoxylon sp. CO27-5]